jgi:hypothetical protein
LDKENETLGEKRCNKKPSNKQKSYGKTKEKERNEKK